MPRHYCLQCSLCGVNVDDDGVLLSCGTEHRPALLTTQYAARQFEPDTCQPGIFRYRCWLPAARSMPKAGGTVTYQSAELSRALDLPQLWIAFNGYWPERGAALETATFKELEAYAVLSRIPAWSREVLVVASAGNTAAAFARLCSRYEMPCLIVIPMSGLQRLRFTEPLAPCVKIVVIGGCADYYDAITFADRFAGLPGFVPEGGVKNVARRDGLGTTLLNAVETIGRLPDYYFQGVGSGSGGIAVHEAAKRLVADGRYGQTLPRLMLSQNFPFAPIHQSWQTKQRELLPIDRDAGKLQIQQVMAQVLSNLRPPYGVVGGVYDALTESHGNTLIAGNCETRRAMDLFEQTEGIDIDPAAGVALATLMQANREGRLDREALVLLNITGGGWCRMSMAARMRPIQPDAQIDASEICTRAALERVLGLF